MGREMDFVFYDTETTGTATDFDQILQFAAIKTDAQLRELDRIEMRCQLQHHVVPHPAALRVTKVGIRDITSAALPSHYDMVRAVRAKFLSWSPAIFVGYNSMRFDEELLRQALFQTLHPPYLTSMSGNCRADAMTLVQAVSALVPGCLAIPSDEKGAATFRLDQVAPKNGFNHADAHDALADVQATIHLLRRVKSGAPDCWDRFVRFSRRVEVQDFVSSQPGFLLTEFYASKPYHFVIGWFGNDPEQSNSALCLDLRHDLDQVAAMDQAKLEAFLDKSPKPLRRLGTNRAPHICTLAEAPLGCLGGLAIEEAEARANRLKEDAGLRDRLVAAALATKTKYETSAHIEEQLYERFVGRADEVRMSRFHEVPWAARGKIVESFEDDRLRYFGRRLLQYHAPQQLLPEHKAELEALTAARLLEQAVPKDKWTSLPMALQATDEELKTAEGEAAAILAEYRAHLSVRLEQLGKGSQRAAGEHGR